MTADREAIADAIGLLERLKSCGSVACAVCLAEVNATLSKLRDVAAAPAAPEKKAKPDG